MNTRMHDNVSQALLETQLQGATSPTLDGLSVSATAFAQTTASTEVSTSTLASKRAQQKGVTYGSTTVLPQVEIINGTPSISLAPRDRFEIRKQLGEGGMGQVLLAHDRDIQRDVAIKRLHADDLDDGTLLRFADEARLIGQLDHPNIVPIHDVGIDQFGKHYLVMKLVDGETLEHIITKLKSGDRDYQQRFNMARRIEIFTDILRAVAYAHARGIIHRDIKPANVMIGKYGEVVLMDWGIAKRIREENPVSVHENKQEDAIPLSSMDAPVSREVLFKTRLGTHLGTPAYMSPEQSKGIPADERSDIYSLCVLFDEFLSLQHYLAEHQTIASVFAAINDPARIHTGHKHGPKQPEAVPVEMLYFAKKGMAKAPADRFQSVNEMLHELLEIRSGHIHVQCAVTFSKNLFVRISHAIDRSPALVIAGVSAMTFMFLATLAFSILKIAQG